MRRVLILYKGLWRGGAERLLLASAPHLDRERFSYQVAYLARGVDALVPELRAAGLPVTCLDAGPSPGWLRRLRELVRRESIDIVHAQSPYPAAGARLALARLGVPIVYTEHNVWQSYHPATRWANLATYHRNRRVIAVSDEVRRSIRPAFGLPPGPMPPIETIYQGVDVEHLASLASADGVRQEFGIPEGAPVVGTLASFKANKGHAYLIEAAVHVRRQIPEVRFLLVGEGPLEEEIRRLAKERGVDDIVVFAGGHANAVRLAASFDVFVLASVYEGLSIALLEAMAIGIAPVVTRVGGLPEAVRDGVDGVLVPPTDPTALADAITQLLRDDGLRSRLATAAAARAAQFDIRITVRRTEQLYLEVA